MTDARPSSRSGPLIAVPLFRSPELVPPLFAALAEAADELAAIDARVLLLNDSPGHAGLEEALARHLPALAAACGATLTANEANVGFVRTANRALALARDEGRDAVLLNSDAIPAAGAFAELAAVAASGPTIGVVSPRSDNATICNSPYPAPLRPHAAFSLAAHRLIEPYLPRTTAVPTAVGFCLYIRHAALVRFGLFDEVYGGGYNEENDYIRRLARGGMRALLANRAYVHHVGSVSFSASDEPATAREIANRAVLDARYPEYGAAVDRWFEGADYRTQRLLAGLVPEHDGRLRITFDCRDAPGDEAAALVAAFAARHAARWRTRLIGPREVPGADMAFHDAWIVPSAAAIRIGAPRDVASVASLGELALVTALVVDGRAVDDLLEAQATAETIDLIGYRDEAARTAFEAAIAVPREVTGFAPDAEAMEAACISALGRIDYASLHRRQSRLALHAAHGRAIVAADDAAAAERAALAHTIAGLHARAEALAADLRGP